MSGIIASNINKEDPLKSVTGYQPTDISINPETDTVQGQVASLTSKDSPQNQIARTNTKQEYNARGLINSSMQVGAAEKAVIETALPIATADAAAYNRNKEVNKSARDTASEFGAQSQNTAAMQQLQGNQSLEQIDKQTAGQSKLNYESSLYDQNLQHLRGDQAQTLTELETEANRIQQATAAAGQISSQHSAAIGQVLANDELTPAAKQQAIDLLNESYRNQLAVLGGINNMDFTGLLDFSGTGTSGSGTSTNPGGGNTQPADAGNDEQIIEKALSTAATTGQSAEDNYESLSRLYPGYTYDQYVEGITQRGYVVGPDGKVKGPA